TVYLIRHGVAMDREDFRGDDLERPLTEAGEKKTRQAMDGLAGLLRTDKQMPEVLSSPARRASQTAEIFRKAWGKQAEILIRDSLKPGATALDYLDAMIYHPLKADRALLIFGHEPEISETCALVSNVHRIQSFYTQLWKTEERNSEILAELQHWLPSDEGEFTVVEGSMQFQIKKCGVVRIQLDAGGAMIQGMYSPSVLRSLSH
ncbi:MAG: histidine phosphatase family protein, partial [Leptospiraceae bacterium]|nr:histidine phosphatase family protein [Leptospiraceae bacterium]